MTSGRAEVQLIGGRAPGGGAGSLGPVTNGAERTRWKIRSDRTVDENPRIRLSVASLELADGIGVRPERTH
jgi:hypothetical protein